jgi:hypothetical protein
MIAVELVRVVVDEPSSEHGWSTPGVTSQVELHAGDSYIKRLVYLPQLALVVAEHRDGRNFVVPVEHVWHMTTNPRGPILEQLAEAIA